MNEGVRSPTTYISALPLVDFLSLLYQRCIFSPTITAYPSTNNQDIRHPPIHKTKMSGSIERQLDSLFHTPQMAAPFEKKPPTPWRPPPTTKILPLSPLDRAMCRVYVRLVYVFPLAEGSRPAALSHLRTRLAATLAQYPFLAGTVNDDNKLRYPSSLPDVTTNADDDSGDTTFRILTVRQDVALPPYEQLAAQAMPPSALHKELLSNLPTHPTGWRHGGWPALGVQANLFAGGLALCFAFHHAVLDGTGMRQVLEVFAGAAAPPTARDLRRTSLLRAGKEGAGVVMREYEDEGVMAALPRGREGNKSRVLRFGAEGLGRLKGEVMKEVERGGGAAGVAFVSTSDVLCALVWVGVMRARWLRGRGSAAVSKEEEVLRADEVARFNIAVNARTKMKPALPAGYVGNAFVVAVAEATVGEVVGFHGEDGDEDEDEGFHEMLSSPSSPPAAAAAPSGRNKMTTTKTTLNNPFHHSEPTPPSTPPQQPTTLPPLTIHTIARAATHIRRAIAAVDDAYIRARFSFVASLPPTSADPTAITKENNTATLKQALDPARTGLDFTSWDAFGAEFDFGIPGTTADGKPAWVRKTWSAGEGAVNILPRKAGAEWFEVLLALAAEDMDAVCGGDGVGLRGCEWWGGEWAE